MTTDKPLILGVAALAVVVVQVYLAHRAATVTGRWVLTSIAFFTGGFAIRRLIDAIRANKEKSK